MQQHREIFSQHSSHFIKTGCPSVKKATASKQKATASQQKATAFLRDFRKDSRFKAKKRRPAVANNCLTIIL
jgi:hypothetical protein